MEKNLTSGSVFKNMMLFSLPYLLSYFLQTLYGMADLFIIGQFEGVASTTAVSVGSQVMHMLTVILVGLAMGTTVAVGQAVGAGDRKKASLSIGNTVTLFLGVSVALTAVLLLCVRPIVGIISTPEEAVEGTVRYLTICFIGIPFITAYNIISSIFRGLGDSKSPMYFIAIACVANIILDYVFMGVFHIGPAGAALGTIISQTISVITALVAMGKKKIGIRVAGGDLKPQGKVMGQLLRVGVPVACQDGLIQVAFIIITIIANRRGLSDAAAVGIVEKIISFVFLVPSSMLSTVSALCAQNIGAGKHDRAAKTLQYGHCGLRNHRVGAGSVLCGAGGWPVYDGSAGADHGRTVFPGVYLGLCVRWDPFQLQWLFLRLWTVGIFLPAQYHRHCPGADSGRVPDVEVICKYPVSYGTCHGLRISAIGGDLRGRVSLSEIQIPVVKVGNLM